MAPAPVVRDLDAGTPLHTQSAPRAAFWLVALLLFLSPLAIYSPTLRHGYMALDDYGYMVHNVEVRSGIGWDSLGWAFTTREQANWHPLTWLSHMLDCEFYGAALPGLHHLTNLLIHALNALLLLILLYRLSSDLWPAAFVAAIFALHPTHIESVAWISERKDVLSTCFWLICLLSYAEYAKGRGRRWYLGALLSLALGLMSKPMLVTAPFLPCFCSTTGPWRACRRAPAPTNSPGASLAW